MGKVIRALTDDGFIRITVFDSTDVVTKAKKIHSLTNVAAAALGRLLTGAVIMAADMKETDNRICLNVRSDGEIGTLAAESYKTGEVKGFVSNPNVNLPLRADGKLDVGGALGYSGSLSVIKDFGTGEPQTGTVELISGEIAEDISYYYSQSEQIPTAVALGVLVSKDGIVLGSGGYMLQLLPDCPEETLEKAEKNINNIPKNLSLFFAEDKDPHELVKTLLSDMPYKIIEEYESVYKCDCTKERVERALLSIGKNELKKIMQEDEDAEVTCHYCNKKYNFSKKDLENLLSL